MANFNERWTQLKALASIMQQNNYVIFLLRERQKQLQGMIAANNPILARSGKNLTEKMEVLRAEQMEYIKSLDFINAALNEALTEKNLLWAEFHKLA